MRGGSSAMLKAISTLLRLIKSSGEKCPETATLRSCDASDSKGIPIMQASYSCDVLAGLAA